MSKLISILIPCRPKRPDLIRDCLRSLVDKTSDKDEVEICIKVDIGDMETMFAVNTFVDKLDIKVIRLDGSRGKADFAFYTNELAKKSTGDLIWWWSDEVRILTDDWDNLMTAYRHFFREVATLYPAIEKGTPGCYPIITRRWLELTGRWSWSVAVDWWIWAVAARVPSINKMVMINELKIKDTTISGETTVDSGKPVVVEFEGDVVEAELQKDVNKIKEAYSDVE